MTILDLLNKAKQNTNNGWRFIKDATDEELNVACETVRENDHKFVDECGDEWTVDVYGHMREITFNISY